MPHPDLHSQRTTLPNGRTRVAVSLKPIRFVDPEGQLRDYDASIVMRDGVYVCAAMPFTFRTLPDGIGFVYGDTARGETTYRLRGAAQRGQPVIEGNAVWFPNALAQIDVGFVVSRNGVRALKRLKHATAAKVFVWDVETSGTPIQTRPPVGRDNADEKPTAHVPARRDLEIATVESAMATVGGVTRWTLTETWTGRVLTFTKPNRIPQWTADPVYPVTMDPTVGPLGSASDDGEETSGTWNDRYYHWTAGRSGATVFDAGVRFTSVTVPQGATITSATLDFDVVTNYGGAAGSVLIHGDDVDDAPTWTDSSKPSSGFTATTASTLWTFDASTGTVSKDVTAVVQELVDRVGWASGNAMRFALLNQLGSGTRIIEADASDATGNETLLTIEYTVAGTYAPGAGAIALAGTQPSVYIVSGAYTPGVGLLTFAGTQPSVYASAASGLGRLVGGKLAVSSLLTRGLVA